MRKHDLGLMKEMINEGLILQKYLLDKSVLLRILFLQSIKKN